jgi:NAD(P)-dependent dehydrogenase (short-subunit alcohol dehydrogenase family)
VTGIACDVSELEQVQRLARHTVETFGGFDIWVNNAGQAGPYGPTADIDPQSFTRVIRTNIFGSYYGSLVALRYLLSCKSGKLINILGRGEEGPAPMQAAYGSSKAWERAFTLALARENRESGVGIYAFNPGLMITDFLTDVTVVEGYSGRLKPFRTIIRMWGAYPEVPAEKAVWLASHATDGKTGMLVRQSNPFKIILGAVNQGFNLLLRKTNPVPELNITEIPRETMDYTV